MSIGRRADATVAILSDNRPTIYLYGSVVRDDLAISKEMEMIQGVGLDRLSLHTKWATTLSGTGAEALLAGEGAILVSVLGQISSIDMEIGEIAWQETLESGLTKLVPV